MTVESYAPAGRDAVVFESSRVVIKDSHGNAICVAVDYGDGHTLVSHIDDPDFEEILKTFGISMVTVRNRIQV